MSAPLPLNTIPEGDGVEMIEVELRTYQIVLSSGKPATIGIPDDMTDRDWLDYQAILLTVVRPEHIRRTGGNPLVNLILRRR